MNDVTKAGSHRDTAPESAPIGPRIARRKTFGLIAAASVAPSLMLSRRVLAGEPFHLTLLHTNDTHSRMEPFEKGPNAGRAGVAKRATLIRQVRKENPNTLVLDGGDTFQGTAWFNEYKGSVDIEVMKALGYNAAAVGNHDFDAGADTLRKNLDLAPSLHALAANFVIEAGSPLDGRVRENAIVVKGGRKIGLFGLGVKFEGLVHPRMHPGVSWKEPVEVGNEQVAILRDQGCDVVIALSHLGYSGYAGEMGDTDWPTRVAGVDYVVGGHSHTFLKEPKMVAHPSGWKTAVMQVGHSGLNVGRADLWIDSRGKVALQRCRPLGIGGRALVDAQAA